MMITYLNGLHKDELMSLGNYLCVECLLMRRGPSWLLRARESPMLPSWPLVLIVTRKFWFFFYFSVVKKENALNVYVCGEFFAFVLLKSFAINCLELPIRVYFTLNSIVCIFWSQIRMINIRWTVFILSLINWFYLNWFDLMLDIFCCRSITTIINSFHPKYQMIVDDWKRWKEKIQMNNKHFF